MSQVLPVSIYPDDKVEIYLGAHADDAAMNAYADCSMEFIEAMNRAISIGTYSQENIVAPFAGKIQSRCGCLRFKTRSAL